MARLPVLRSLRPTLRSRGVKPLSSLGLLDVLPRSARIHYNTIQAGVAQGMNNTQIGSLIRDLGGRISNQAVRSVSNAVRFEQANIKRFISTPINRPLPVRLLPYARRELGTRFHFHVSFLHPDSRDTGKREWITVVSNNARITRAEILKMAEQYLIEVSPPLEGENLDIVVEGGMQSF